ncbi:TonB-dependent receptor [Simiduia agarivorans]|uniref:TonB-dependent receptor n=1 Tax=Simiduia agarivorans (strain DSM 21679 / JCM 13881 / BCRC 17597 / SA1) TaxID=1117647 RepID=R9S637_SIMAS|nr:TonB-dependent receptor [Simiduia agarivorans]AGN11328.1 putative TonB-dependent receptor [Simiduia agarivorans SA1 = DSM 21679]
MTIKTAKAHRVGMALLAFSIAAASHGQDNLTLEEIVVTAQKRPQSLQDVPLSVSALGGEKMDAAGLNNLEAVSTYVPNFSINQTGISTTISIRGISSGINQGFEQSVGMYVDGIYYGRAQLARAPLFDMERVEVLRGPQGILFGKNSIAGAVSQTSAKPSQDFESRITALYEPEHGEKDLRAVISGGLTDDLAGRLSVMKRDFDGYVDNTSTGKKEPAADEWLVRGQVRWDASDNLALGLKLEQSQFDVSGRNIEVIGDTAGETGVGLSTVYPIFSGGEALDADQNGKRQANGDTSENKTHNATLNIDYQWGEHQVTAITGLAGYEYDELCDCEYTGLNTFTLGLDEAYRQWSQELRIVSPVGEALEYIAGVFYQDSHLEFHDDFNVPTTSALTAVSSALAGYNSQRFFEQDSQLWAAFAQATYHVNDQWSLTLGGRYTTEQKTASRFSQSSTQAPNPDVIPGVTLLDLAENVLRAEPHSEAGKRDEDSFTPLINLQYQISDSAMLYATYTTGFKSGGFDVRSNASSDPAVGVPGAVTSALGQPPSPVGVFEFEEEEATSFELGAKTSLLDDRAELNAAVFRTEYDNLQVSIFDGGLGFNVGNAAAAISQGIELDGRLRASESLTFTAAIGYLDFEFTDYDNGECYFRQAEFEPDTVTNAALDMCSFDGKRQAYTPELTGSLITNYQHQFQGGLVLNADLDLIYSSEYLASPSLDPRLTQDAFVKVNARLALAATDGFWEIALVGKNLTDEAVLTYGAEVPTSATLVGAATGQQGLAYYGFYDRPRSIALQARLQF